MKHQCLFAPVLFVLTLFFFACAPQEEIPVLETGDTASFTLIQTTDVHHHVVGTGPSASYGTANDTTRGGYSRIATAIQNIKNEKRSQNVPTVLVDSGDFFMGTVYDLSLGESPAAFNFFTSMNYDAVTLGNHEFDYGPKALGSFFCMPLPEDESEPFKIYFKVPVIMSNMVTDQETGTDDDYLESLFLAGEMKTSMIIILDNGLKVGILGLMGQSAESDIVLKDPVTFVNDWDGDGVDDDGDGSTDEDAAAIQAMVDALREQGAHVVIALAHGGIVDPNGTPSGDDVALAENVSGIDIIASGHQHEVTESVVTVSNTENDTYIICAGRYGNNVAQLDVTVTVGSGVTTTPTLTNHTIDSTVEEDDLLTMILVDQLDIKINEALVANGLPEVNEIVASTDSDNMELPEAVEETGIGNLTSDSLRYLLGGAGNNPSLGIVANGVIRNGYQYNQLISFADLYNTLPLGMTMDPDNQNIPGYPLLMVYFSKDSIRSLCQLSALTVAAQYNTALSALKSDYYLNFSGVRYSFSMSDFLVREGDVEVYGANDFSCQGPVSTISDGSYLPCVVDLYTALVFLDSKMAALIESLNMNSPIYNISITPMMMGDAGLEPLSLTNVQSARLDMDLETDGVQEVKEWMALFQFVSSPVAYSGLGTEIHDSVYGSDALSTGTSSRVTITP